MRVLIVLFFVVLAHSSSAQEWKKNHEINKPVMDIQATDGNEIQVKQAPRNIGRVQGMVGQVYHADQMNNLGTRSINKISGMTMGVESRSGAEPVFKATPGGTAYFVDGIRIRSGSLCIPGFTF